MIEGTDQTFRPQPGDEMVQVNFRLTRDKREFLEKIAEIDGNGGGVIGLVYEGLARVFDDRLETSDLRAQLHANSDNHLRQLQADMEYIDALAVATKLHLLFAP